MTQNNVSQRIPRYDIYATIHKALRAMMCGTLVAAGRADADDAAEVAALLAQVRELAAFCAGHLQHENDFVHAAMEARRPGSARHTAGDHGHHEHALGQLHALADEVEQARAGQRSAALTRLYRYLALFVAENLTHMNVEETENNAVLWAAYTDGELLEIEGRIVAAIAPAEMASAMRWMIPAMNAGERAEKLAGIREKAPAPVFDAVLGIGRAYLSARDWGKLTHALAQGEQLAA